MTVSYQYDVASSSTGGFFRLLWRWRGSIWKLLYRELVLFMVLYLILALSYDFLLNDYYKRYYERIVIFCSNFVELIPLSFILGFYVSFTATRWWDQYTAIPWPDKCMNIIALYVPGNDETSRLLRRTLMRYLNLTLVLVLRSISIAVKRRFPTKEHLVEAGFMTKPELEMYTAVPSNEFNTFWIPCTWFVNLLRQMKQECRVTDSNGLKLIMEEFNDFRTKCGLLWSYDWVSIPLVYTQVVTLATHAFFVASLIGRQHINADNKVVPSNQYAENYIPVFTILQFMLYMGLLKLGEQLINPFGDDDEDFELNWIIDRHLKVSFLGVDVLNVDPPPLIKDNYFDEMDIKLPYTQAALNYKIRTYRGSVDAFHVPVKKQGLVVPEIQEENEEKDEVELVTHSSAKPNSMWSILGNKVPPKSSKTHSLTSIDSELMVENTGIESLWDEAGGFNKNQQIDNENINTSKSLIISSSQGTRGGEEFIINMSPNSEKEMFLSAKSTSQTQSFYNKELHQFIQESPRKSSISCTSSNSTISKASSQQKLAGSTHQIDKSFITTTRSTTSTLHTKKVKMLKTSLFKQTRSRDPHLKIRPFRSKVTFSEDTKCDDGDDGTESIESSSKSLLQRALPAIETSNIPEGVNIYEQDPNTQLDLDSPIFQLISPDYLRRQSICQAEIAHSEAEVVAGNEEKWLHHQSLPNIQEDENELTVPPSPTLVRKISFKRQKCVTSETTHGKIVFSKQLSEPDENQLQNLEIEDSRVQDTNNSLEKYDSSSSIKCKKKQSKNRQSSTESDTGSYHTAKSFLMQISEENIDIKNHSSSSIESYLSASEETQSCPNIKNIENIQTNLTVIDSDLPKEIKNVPLITVTQSVSPVSSVHELNQDKEITS